MKIRSRIIYTFRGNIQRLWRKGGGDLALQSEVEQSQKVSLYIEIFIVKGKPSWIPLVFTPLVQPCIQRTSGCSHTYTYIQVFFTAVDPGATYSVKFPYFAIFFSLCLCNFFIFLPSLMQLATYIYMHLLRLSCHN